MDDRDDTRHDGVSGGRRDGGEWPPGGNAGERRRANVDIVVHHTLAVGVAVGFALLVVGLALTVAGRGGLGVLSLKAPVAWRAALHGRAAGFYSLGLLALILTPFVRVVGSIVAFAAARDWRFVAVTSAVLAVMIASIVIGAA